MQGAMQEPGIFISGAPRPIGSYIARRTILQKEPSAATQISAFIVLLVASFTRENIHTWYKGKERITTFSIRD